MFDTFLKRFYVLFVRVTYNVQAAVFIYGDVIQRTKSSTAIIENDDVISIV